MQNKELNTCKQDIYYFLHIRLPTTPRLIAAWADKTKSFVKDGTIAHIGNHRHKMNGRNDAYTFTYLYRLGFDIAPGAGKLTLPEDADINIFAITVSGNRIDGTRWACEPRALPVTE